MEVVAHQRHIELLIGLPAQGRAQREALLVVANQEEVAAKVDQVEGSRGVSDTSVNLEMSSNPLRKRPYF